MLIPRGDATHSNPLAVLGALAGAFGGGGGGEEAHGLLAGLGDAASKENEQRIMEQRRVEDEDRAGRDAVAEQLLSIGLSEDWTPGARSEALRARMELIQNPKAKPEKLMAAVMEASKRERVEAKARNTEREQLTGLSRFSGQFGVPLNPDAVGAGQNAEREAAGQQSVSEDMLALGGGQGQATPQPPPQTWWLAPGSSPGIGPGPVVPSMGMPADAKAAADEQWPEMLAALGPMEEVMQQGPYSPEERQAQGLDALRGQLSLQSEFRPKKPDKIQYVNRDDGIYAFGPDGEPMNGGRPVGQPKAATKKVQYVNRDEGIYMFDEAGNPLNGGRPIGVPKPPSSAGGGTAAGPADAETIADAIISGNQPPEIKGLYRLAGPVKAALARKGYNLTAAMQDWSATQRHLTTLNGPQQLRLRQAVSFTADSLDVVEDLAEQWKAGGFPLLNKARLGAARQGLLGKQAQAIATQMESQISDLVSELAVVYRGGNASTDESLKLAAQNLKSEWSLPTLLKNVALVRKNLLIRKNSLASTQVAGVGGRYTPNADGSGAGDSADADVTHDYVPGKGLVPVKRP